ncbi:MAG: site-specific integrase, partial [Terriglobales bacterium]
MGANSKAEIRSPKPETRNPELGTATALLHGYLEHLANERRLSRHTVENYGRDITALLALAAGARLKHLDVQQVRRHVAQLHARGLDGRTLARMLSAWRGFFNYLARDHGYTHNPCLGIRPPKSAKRLPHALSPDEAGRLMEIAAADPLALRDKAILELLYSSG